MGDFWWYSLMLFVACRAADLMNAFVGLWLVPKYVDPSELGAVMPLANFANLLALPVAAFANTFRNEVSRLSIRCEFGRLKTLMRGVFVATAIFLFLAIIVARFTLPLLLERIRIVEGSLGFLIIAASFVGAIAPIFSNALQALKKFSANAMMNIIGAPVRLITMLVSMPFRPLSGYFVGQAATPAFNILSSLFYLRRELSAPAEKYWSKDTVKRFGALFATFALIGIVGGACTLVESTVLRQRLPDMDSAGYYMATRFSEIANFLLITLCFTIFPFTAESASKGNDPRPLILKSTAATICFSAIVAAPFFFFGERILAFLPHGESYCAYWWAIPWLIGIGCLSAFVMLYTTSEISANRFGYVKWLIPFNIAYPVALLLVTGYGYFVDIIPESWTTFLRAHNIHSLDTMLWWMTAANLFRATGCALMMATQGKTRRKA
jgi:O-antigen/teichoic acid export membrane protein